MPPQHLETLLNDLYSPNQQDAWAEFLSAYSSPIYQVVRHFEADPDNAADCFQFVCEQLIDRRSSRLKKFRGEGSATFTTWLRAIVRNLCIDWHRKQLGRQRLFSSVTQLPVFDQHVFRMIYEQAVPPEDCVAILAAEFPNTTIHQITESRNRIEGALTPKQRWLLAQRVGNQNGNAGHSEEILRDIKDASPDPEARAIENERRQKLERAMKSLSNNERLLIRLRFEEGLTLEKAAALLGLGNAQKADRKVREILERLRKLM
jgi:RNA polymerase sigma factor (sigma-70 family)